MEYIIPSRVSARIARKSLQQRREKDNSAGTHTHRLMNLLSSRPADNQRAAPARGHTRLTCQRFLVSSAFTSPFHIRCSPC